MKDALAEVGSSMEEGEWQPQHNGDVGLQTASCAVYW